MIAKSKNIYCRGFSLVELMVALLLFMVAVLGLAPLLNSNMHADARNQLRAEARDVAVEEMDKLQVDRFQDLSVGTLKYEVERSVGEKKHLYDVLRNIEANGLTPTSDQLKITVRVEWPYRGNKYDYQIVSVRTHNGE